MNTIAANNSPTISAIGEARIGPLMALPRVLEEAGISAAALFREAGIAPDLFDHPDNRIAYETLVGLLSACATRSGRDGIGLMAGARFTLL
nr:AraC family transcriptional regulator ligand-binding domain-containing protein [Halioglobus sp.]